MYNRYIPQPDGSYRRNRMQEPRQPRPQRPAAPSPEPCAPNPVPAQEHKAPPRCNSGNSVPGFLRQLLPRDFDTGDLMVVLLLLLMAGDSEEDRSNAILTLALYFIM